MLNLAVYHQHDLKRSGEGWLLPWWRGAEFACPACSACHPNRKSLPTFPVFITKAFFTLIQMRCSRNDCRTAV